MVLLNNQKAEEESSAMAEISQLQHEFKNKEAAVLNLRSRSGWLPYAESSCAEATKHKEEYEEVMDRRRLAEHWLRQVEDDEWRAKGDEEQAKDEARMYQRFVMMSENMRMQAPKTGVSKREHEEISAPLWPTVGSLLTWKAEIISNVCVASECGGVDICGENRSFLPWATNRI